METESARGYLARLIQQRAEDRFDAVQSRADLRAVARLMTLAIYLESEPTIGGVLAYLTPSNGSREFPSSMFWDLTEQYAAEPNCDLPMLVRCLVHAELAAAIEAELPLLT